MSFTETTQQGFLSRIGGSFLGLLFGPLLIVAAVVLLWWNEGRAVQAVVGLSAAASATVEAQDGAISPANEGKLVHVVGQATASSPITDPDLGLSLPGQVAVARNVEMYQWREHQESHTQNNLGGSQTTTTTYTYAQEWSDEPIDSGAFRHADGHQNPPMPFRSTRFAATDAKLGAWTLDSGTLGNVQLAPSLSPAPAAPSGWTATNNVYVKGNLAQPKTGDLRVTYSGLASGTTVSILAAQSHGGFAPFVTPNGYQVDLAASGNVPAALMIAQKKAAESTLTWILRAVGAVVMFAGFALFLGPLSTLASVIPFLGTIVRGAAAALAFVMSVPITLTVIALAWLAYRPLIGGGLLVAAIAALVLLGRWHAARRPAKAAAA
jgi:hypothetical protein